MKCAPRGLLPSLALVALVACASNGAPDSSDAAATSTNPATDGASGSDGRAATEAGTTTPLDASTKATDGGATIYDTGATPPYDGATSSYDSTTTLYDGATPATDAANLVDSFVGPGSYALGPPNVCSNRFSTQDCQKGDATSACAGICANDYGPTAANVCTAGATGIPVNYACPRDMLYSDEMNQAAIDDGFGGTFNYSIVGHDKDIGSGGIDQGLTDACCQCYQLVFDYPSENQAWVNPNDSTSPQSAVTVPMPMVVQSANTGTNGIGDMDIFMGAGGFGTFNGCYVQGGACPGGPCMYSAFSTSTKEMSRPREIRSIRRRRTPARHPRRIGSRKPR